MASKNAIIAITAVVVIVIAAAAVLALGGGSNDSGTQSREPVATTLYLDWGNSVEEYTGTGSTISEIITDALGDDHEAIFRSNGTLYSVDGQTNADNMYWTVFRWASPGGWTVFSESSSSYVDGMSIAVSYSERVTNDDGTYTYSAPDIDVEYEVWYFLQVREGITNDWIDSLGVSRAILEEGFWISGTGSTNNEALADAVISTFFSDSDVQVVTSSTDEGDSITYLVDGEVMFSYGTRSDMYGWFLEFLGHSDEAVGSDSWRYWTQFSYNPDAETLDDTDQWNYNNLSFGMYDISRYHYFGLVLKTSAMEDQFIDISTPSDIPGA